MIGGEFKTWFVKVFFAIQKPTRSGALYFCPKANVWLTCRHVLRVSIVLGISRLLGVVSLDLSRCVSCCNRHERWNVVSELNKTSNCFGFTECVWKVYGRSNRRTGSVVYLHTGSLKKSPTARSCFIFWVLHLGTLPTKSVGVWIWNEIFNLRVGIFPRLFRLVCRVVSTSDIPEFLFTSAPRLLGNQCATSSASLF